MEEKEKIILIIGSVLLVFVLYFYFYYTLAGSSIVIYAIFVPALVFLIYEIYRSVQNNTLLNVGGTINVFNYYEDNPVYLQIYNEGKQVWDDYVDFNSVTQYQWEKSAQIRAIGSDDPNLGNPSTVIYFDLTYPITGIDNILVVLNADGTYFEQLSSL